MSCTVTTASQNVGIYLHDNELQDQWQLSDVTRWQVKQEGGVPDGVASAGAFCFLGADYFPFLTQVDDNVMVYGGRNDIHTHSHDFVLHSHQKYGCFVADASTARKGL